MRVVLADQPQTIRIGRSRYVVIAKAEYDELRARAGLPAGSVDAVDYAERAIARTLRQARMHAELTQAELATKLGVRQSMVSQAETGAMSVSDRYLRRVLDACGLSDDWHGTKPAPARKRRPRR